MADPVETAEEAVRTLSLNVESGSEQTTPPEAGVSAETTSDSDEMSDYSDDSWHGEMDLADMLRIEIENGDYTCLICTGEIGVSSRVWSCDVCYRVYDLECIQGWSRRQMEKSPTKEWRCPSCNSSRDEKISEYRCWCGKAVDPFYNGLVPHSCGQTCGAKLGCVHGCPETCHPGPHTECTAIGPPLHCDCGKSRKQWPCVITPYSGWQCGRVCGELLPCGEHRCQKKCHSGLCGRCEEQVPARCYCGKEDSRPVPCWSRYGRLSEVGSGERWVGYFACGAECDALLSCGKHRCRETCHSRAVDDHACPDAPVAGEKCCCGKTPVAEILGRERASCEEARPHCDKVCGRSLKCGHECMAGCHDGECPPCLRVQASKCRCGSQAFDVPCRFVVSGNEAQCKRKCNALRNCRRHRCGRICCAFSKTAAERERLRKKQFRARAGITLEPDAAEERAHTCEEECGRLLNCGKHRCVLPCHPGQCHPCLESSPEDYVCPCGRTVLRAPIRCGSMLPQCKFDCQREPACGHPRVKHECHADDVPCPRCPHLVERRCICGRNTVRGVQCWNKAVSCGKICGNPLACGHSCPKACHPPGECATSCSAPCRRELACGHKHQKPCHYPADCTGPCPEKVNIACPCGTRTQTIPCPGTAEPPSPLECDDECAEAARKKQLAAAFEVDLFEEIAKSRVHDYDPDTIDMYRADPLWCGGIERQLTDFVNSGTRQHLFPPMNRTRRAFIHALAAEFNLISVSVDPEPQRSVSVTRQNSSSVPVQTLDEAWKSAAWQSGIRR